MMLNFIITKINSAVNTTNGLKRQFKDMVKIYAKQTSNKGFMSKKGKKIYLKIQQ